MARPVGEVLGAPIEPHPQETAHTAPTLPVDAPDVGEGLGAGVGAPEGSTGLPGAPRGRGKPKRDRRAQRTPPLSLYLPRDAVASRARALALVAEDCAGTDETPPVPLAIACRLRGLPLRTVEEAIATGRCPGLESKRAEGVVRALRLSMRDTANGRNWWQLAERLAPKELHLPTKVHTGQDADAAPMQVAALVVPADPRAIRAELRLVQQQIAGLLGPGEDD